MGNGGREMGVLILKRTCLTFKRLHRRNFLYFLHATAASFAVRHYFSTFAGYIERLFSIMYKRGS